MAPPLSPGPRSWLALAAALVVAACLGRNAGEFWSLRDDYPATSLGLAINVQRWLEAGERDVSRFQNWHYTIPLQLGSWASLRLAAPPATDPVQSALADPSAFGAWNRRLTLLSSVAGILGLWWLSRGTAAVPAALGILGYFTADAARWYGLEMMGNDTFALPAAPLFFAAAAAALRSGRASTWLVLGLLAGALVFVKLNYLAWAIGGLAALLWLRWNEGLDRASLRDRVVWFLAGLGLAVSAIGGAYFGLTGLGRMLQIHAGIAWHTDLYGYGGPGVIDLRRVAISAVNMLRSPDVWVVPATCALAAIAVLGAHRRDRAWLREQGTAAVWLLVSMAATVATALKHWSGHYVLPANVLTPLLVFWLARQAPARLSRLVAAVVAVFLLRAVWQSRVEALAHAEQSRVDAEDARRLEALPLRAGEVRLWSWRTGSPRSLALLADWFSVTRPVSGSDSRPQDMLFDIWGQRVVSGPRMEFPELVPWRHVAFDRGVVPGLEQLPPYFRRCGLERAGFGSLLVLERAPGCAPDPVPARAGL